MKLSAALLSALAVVSLAAPAPASRKPSQLARRSRLSRQSLLQHKSRSKGLSAAEGQDSSSGFGGDSQGTPTGAAGGSWPTGTSSGPSGQSSGSFGSSGSDDNFGPSPSGGFGSGSDSGFGPSPSGSFGSDSDSGFGSSPSGGVGPSPTGGFGSGTDSSFGASPSGSFGSSGSDSSAGASPSGSFGSSGSSGFGSSGSGNSGFGGQSSATAAASVPTSVATKEAASTSSNDEYNENWAGVVVEGDAGTVTGVSASFTLPTIKRATDGVQADATVHTASQWIGIDGYSCGTGLWQAGVDGNVAEDGTVSWYAWYEWYPADTVVADIGDLAAGDVISVNITASSTTEGTVVMSNAASGKSFTKTMTSTDELCLADAEWIEEDLVIDDASGEGLANFGSVTFKDAIATTKTGTMSPGDNPIYMDVEDSDNTVLTSSSASGNTVTVKYAL